MKISNYKLIYRATPESLEKDVNDLLEKGWQPIGAAQPFVKHENIGGGESVTDNRYLQTMVKYDDESSSTNKEGRLGMISH